MNGVLCENDLPGGRTTDEQSQPSPADKTWDEEEEKDEEEVLTCSGSVSKLFNSIVGIPSANEGEHSAASNSNQRPLKLKLADAQMLQQWIGQIARKIVVEDGIFAGIYSCGPKINIDALMNVLGGNLPKKTTVALVRLLPPPSVSPHYLLRLRMLAVGGPPAAFHFGFIFTFGTEMSLYTGTQSAGI
ncbi:hypothetical protein GPALN_002103 [Globodera pallida]|nr:hypothetical protein GPALN_002103 [Globodera pallida]